MAESLQFDVARDGLFGDFTLAAHDGARSEGRLGNLRRGGRAGKVRIFICPISSRHIVARLRSVLFRQAAPHRSCRSKLHWNCALLVVHHDALNAFVFPSAWQADRTSQPMLSVRSERREFSNVRNPCDDLTQGKSSKIVNQGPPAFARRGELRLGRPDKRLRLQVRARQASQGDCGHGSGSACCSKERSVGRHLAKVATTG